MTVQSIAPMLVNSVGVVVIKQVINKVSDFFKVSTDELTVQVGENSKSSQANRYVSYEAWDGSKPTRIGDEFGGRIIQVMYALNSWKKLYNDPIASQVKN